MSGRPVRNLTIIIPCFNEEQVISETLQRVVVATASLPGWRTEIVVVDDGSTDDTAELARRFPTPKVASVRVLQLSRRFGHQAALAAGLEHSDGDATAIIDADLQDPPELLPEMIRLLDEGFDVVFGERKKREGASLIRRAGYLIFYRLFRALAVGLEIPSNTGDFRVMNKKVTRALQSMPEKQRFLRGLVPWVGFRQTGLAYSRPARYAGETKYSLSRLTSLAMDGLISFSSRPLRFATWAGLIGILLAVVSIVAVLIVRLATDIWEPGWASVVIVSLFFGGAQLFSIGILGEYLAKIFLEVKGRPTYILRGDTD